MQTKPPKCLVDDADLKVDIVHTTDEPCPLPSAGKLKAALAVFKRRKGPRRLGKRPKVTSANVRDAGIAVHTGGLGAIPFDAALVARVLRSNARLSRMFRDALADLFEDRVKGLRVAKRPPGRGNRQKKTQRAYDFVSKGD